MTDTINRCCGAICEGSDRERDDEPCWGNVGVVAEECYDDDSGGDHCWHHACEGHADIIHQLWSGGTLHGEKQAVYKPAPDGCETVRSWQDESNLEKP